MKPAFAALCALLVACRADPSHRQDTLAAAGRADRALAADSVATLLRAPSESTRIIYSRPTQLARPDTVTAASAPFGVATPDSGHSRGAATPGSRTPQSGAARMPGADSPKARPRTGG